MVPTNDEDLNPANILQTPAHPLEELCGQCSRLNPDRDKRDLSGTILTDYERHDEYPDYPALKTSAEAGCRMCSFLRASLLSVQNIRSYEAEPNETHPFWGPGGEDVILHLPWDRRVHLTARFEYGSFDAGGLSSSTGQEIGSEEQKGGMVLFMWLIWKSTSGAVRDGKGNEWGSGVLVFPTFDLPDLDSPKGATRRRLPSSRTLSPANVDLMRRWISDCRSKHSDCPSPGRAWLPSRLLEISGTEDSPMIRLAPMTEAHITQGCQYAALSHMWGDMTVSPPYRTFLSNFEQHKDEIDHSKLPRNFQDALKVSSALGIRYLWIDSLCIIQDSDSDWGKQAVTMHLVYRHAQVTIVATQASSSHGGFLQRDIELSRAIKIEYNAGKAGYLIKSETNATARRSIIICRHASAKEGQRIHAIDGAKWNTRGWTMQERSLSTRTIHFCRNKLFFECRGSLLSEENEPPQEVELLSHVMWPRGEGVSDQRLYENWELHVNEYCRRNLTKSRDKLLAIRSIAEEMSDRTEMEYIPYAGMWKPHFKRELLWSVSFGQAEEPPVPRAPSWSWAALEAHTHFVEGLLGGTKRHIPDFLKAQFQQNPFQILELSGADTTPSTNHGLQIYGLMMIQTLTMSLDGEAERLQDPGKWRNFFPVNFSIKQSQEVGSDRQVVAHGKFDIGGQGFSGPFLYAHIGESSRITGLVLERVAAEGIAQMWQRVGVASLFDDKTGEPIASNLFGGSRSADRIVIV